MAPGSPSARGSGPGPRPRGCSSRERVVKCLPSTIWTWLFLIAGISARASLESRLCRNSSAPNSRGWAMMMTSGFMAITPSRLVVWFSSMPASSAKLIPPAAVMTPPSEELPPATHSLSEYCVSASTLGLGSALPVTATRDSCRSPTSAANSMARSSSPKIYPMSKMLLIRASGSCFNSV